MFCVIGEASYSTILQQQGEKWPAFSSGSTGSDSIADEIRTNSDSGQRIHPRLFWFVFIERDDGDPLAIQLFVINDSAA